MVIIRRFMLVGVLMAGPGAGACATSPEPFEYESHNETKQGRGAFTGEEGTWTIYRQEMPPEPQAEPAKASPEQPGKETVGPNPEDAEGATRE